MTTIRKYQESDLFPLIEKIEDVLQGYGTIFNPPVSFVISMPCVIYTEQLVSKFVAFGFFKGVSYGTQYGLSGSGAFGCTYDQVLKTVSPVCIRVSPRGSPVKPLLPGSYIIY